MDQNTTSQHHHSSTSRDNSHKALNLKDRRHSHPELTPLLRDMANHDHSHDHKEHHTGNSELIRDSIIGFADGITVPFALTAGLSSLGNSKLVVIGGLAELFAGAISMGLGAWLAAMTEKKHYEVEEAREWREVRDKPNEEEEEIYQIFDQYGIERSRVKPLVEGLRANEDMWVRFMMDFELKLSKPAVKFACLEGLVMGISYFVGGLLPLLPYFIFRQNVLRALEVSIALTGFVLLVFGFVKARITGCGYKSALYSAVETLAVGSVAAAVAYGIVRAVDSSGKV